MPLETGEIRWDHVTMSVGRVGRTANELYADNDELKHLCLWLHGYCMKVRHVWKKALAKRDISHELVLPVWKGEADDKQLKEFVTLVRRFREECGAENKGLYARTSFTDTIRHQLDIARLHSDEGDPYIVIFIGGAGCGKSTSFEHWAVDNNHGASCYYRAKHAGGIKAVLGDLAEINGCNTTQNHARTLNAVFDCFWPGRVLLVDEAHGLLDSQNPKQRKLEVLRSIVDDKKCAMALAFTDDNFERDIAQSGYIFNQLAWRGRFIRLPRCGTDNDIRVLFKFRCPDLTLTPTLFEKLQAVNEHEMGGFGGVSNVIKDAIFEANKRNVELTESLLLTSLRMQYGAGDPEKNQKPGGKEATLRMINRYRKTTGGRR